MKDLLSLIDKAREVHPKAHRFEPIRYRGGAMQGWTFVREPAHPLQREFMWISVNGEISRDTYRSKGKARSLLMNLIVSANHTN